MTSTLKVLDRSPITYESAIAKNENILNEAAHFAATEELYRELWGSRNTIEGIVRHHLGLGSRDSCVVSPPRDWIRGSFNICVLVQAAGKTVVLRCPMPHKLAEPRYPGTVDEKLGCEVGAYAWMQENCHQVRIPFLYGFGFSDGRHFTHQNQASLLSRVYRFFQQCFRNAFGLARLSHYVASPTRHRLPTGYLLLEHIGPGIGRMLSETWDQHRHAADYRRRLFRGISRLILSLASIPQPRIGSFRFHNDGRITLTNRPLTRTTIILENNGAARVAQRDDTYPCTEPYVADMLTLHGNSLLGSPNAILDEADCRGQMAIQTILRTLAHHYINRERRRGPFILQLTDLHASNIFVDDEWNVTCLIDLEWICSLPIEMLSVPYWLAGHSIEDIQGEQFDEFDKVRREFMEVFGQEEQQRAPTKHGVSLACAMLEAWESKGTWFWHCVDSVNAMLYLVADHLCPRFAVAMGPKVEGVLASFWCHELDKVVEKKAGDLKAYEDELGRRFDDAG